VRDRVNGRVNNCSRDSRQQAALLDKLDHAFRFADMRASGFSQAIPMS